MKVMPTYMNKANFLTILFAIIILNSFTEIKPVLAAAARYGLKSAHFSLYVRFFGLISYVGGQVMETICTDYVEKLKDEDNKSG